MPKLAMKKPVTPRKKVTPVELVTDKPDRENFKKILKQYSSAWKKLAKM